MGDTTFLQMYTNYALANVKLGGGTHQGICKILDIRISTHLISFMSLSEIPSLDRVSTICNVLSIRIASK